MNDNVNACWLRGAQAAIDIIDQAKTTGNWEVIDGLAQLLEISADPYHQGAWEVLLEELSRHRRRGAASR